MAQGPFVLTGLGGKVLQRSMNLKKLQPLARTVLAEGWPVFLKGIPYSNSIEFHLTPDNEVTATPGMYASPVWVEEIMRDFTP